DEYARLRVDLPHTSLTFCFAVVVTSSISAALVTDTQPLSGYRTPALPRSPPLWARRRNPATTWVGGAVAGSAVAAPASFATRSTGSRTPGLPTLREVASPALPATAVD